MTDLRLKVILETEGILGMTGERGLNGEHRICVISRCTTTGFPLKVCGATRRSGTGDSPPGSDSMKKHKRRQIVVNKGFQLGIAVTIVMWIFTYLILFSMIVVTAPVIFAVLGDGPLPSVSSVYNDFVSVFARLTLPLLLTLLILGAHATIFLHRIAGPVHRFKLWLRGIREGDLKTEVHLRNTDLLKDLADEMNETLFFLRENIDRAKVAAKKLPEGAESVLSALEKYQTEAVKEEEPASVA
jgi:methyl-accepting chemotaxis protein